MGAAVEGRRARAATETAPIAAILVIWLVLAGVYLSQPGLAWDEALYVPYAVECREWFAGLPGTFNRADIHNTLGRFTSHPPLAIYTMAAGIQALGNSIGTLYAARAASVMSMAALLGAVYFFTLRTRGAVAAAGACVILILAPGFSAYGMLATLEMATALWWFAAAALFYAAMDNRRLAWVAGLAAALAFLTKIHALALPAVLWPWGLWFHGRKARGPIVWSIVLVPVIFFAAWPFLWSEPFVSLGKYFGEKFGFVVSAYAALGIDLKTSGDAVHRMIRRVDVPVLYFGKVYVAAPWHYAIVMTLVTTPITALATAAAGVAGMLRKKRETALFAFLAWNAAFWPIAFSCGLMRPYDGARLLSVMFPFAAILGGIGAQSIWECIPKGIAGKTVGALAAAAAVASLGYGFFTSAPFGTSYYNAVVGGLPGAAAKGLPVTYWGETADFEITTYIDANAPQGARLAAFPMGQIYVQNLRYFGFIRPDIKDVGIDEEWDYLIVANRGDALAGCEDVRQLTAGAAVTRKVQGVPAAWLVEKKR